MKGEFGQEARRWRRGFAPNAATSNPRRRGSAHTAARPCCRARRPRPGARRTRVDAAAQNTRRLLVPLVVAVVVVLTSPWPSWATGSHTRSPDAASGTPPAAPPLTNASSNVPAAPPLTNAAPQPAPPAAPLTNAPTTGPGHLPPDVAAYVQFLKGIEDRRVALSNDTSGAVAMLGVAHQMQSNQSDPDQQSQTAPNNVGKISNGFTITTPSGRPYRRLSLSTPPRLHRPRQ